MSSSPIRDIAFIGLGIMGRHMASHLLAAGYRLHLYNRSRAGAQALIDAGARWHDTPAQAVKGCELLITMVGFPSDVESLYLGPGGLIANAAPGAVLVDMTTSSPELAQRIAARAAECRVHALDAPVSGGEVGARDARLSIMVGGMPEAFERARAVLERLGPSVVLQGGPGAGQHTKMCNQIVIASTMIGVSEGLAYATRSGLDPHRVLSSIRGGAAGSFLLDAMGTRMLHSDYAPGFFTEHFIKDLGIALGEAQRMGLDLPGLALARQLYEGLAARGHARDGTQVLFEHYRVKAVTTGTA